MTVSGKILRKKVTPGQWGNTISFVVQTSGGEKMVSCFDNKLTEEAKAVLQALVEGMYADFDTVANVSKKDGKTYLNIVSATPITQLREDDVPAAQPAGQTGQPKDNQKETGDTRVRSMALAYAKDLAVVAISKVGQMVEDYNPNGTIDLAKRFEKYILAGE